jgi:hypothetical protein
VAWDVAGLQCQHGPTCQRGSRCAVGRRLQQVCLLSGNIFAVWARIEKASPRARDIKVARCILDGVLGGKVVGLQLPLDTIEAVTTEIQRDPASAPYGEAAQQLARVLVGRGVTPEGAKFISRYVNSAVQKPGSSDAAMKEVVRRSKDKVTQSAAALLNSLSATLEQRKELPHQIETIFGDDVRLPREERQVLRSTILEQLENDDGESSLLQCCLAIWLLLLLLPRRALLGETLLCVTCNTRRRHIFHRSERRIG